MDDLANKKCIPCEGGIPAFDIKEIHKYLKKVDGWDVLEDKDKSFYIEKILNLTITQKVKNSLSMLAKKAKKKNTTQILFLAGDTQKLNFHHAIKGLAESDLC